MKILITGGAGYIGSHMARLLVERGEHVSIIDNLENGYRQAVPAQAEFIQADVQDSARLKEIFNHQDIEAVIHFAAYKAAGESVSQPGKYFTNNAFGSLQLLEAMAESGIKRLVFSSTAAVYGNPATLPAKEDMPIQPENPYGESKALVERMLPWYDSAYGIKSVALRYFNVAGAWLDGSLGEDPRRVSNLIPLVVQAAAGARDALKIFGTDYLTPDGTAIRDYIHVLDLVSGHLAALRYLSNKGDSQVVNLGTGKGISVQEVVTAAETITGKKIPVERVERRPGDPAEVWADNTKAKTVLSWQPKYGLTEILESAWQWQQQHPDGFAKEKRTN